MSESNPQFQCVLCSTELNSKEALQEHFREHANKKIDSKGQGNIPVRSQSKSVQPAVNNDPNQKKTNNESVPCDICSMIFTTVTLAIQHKFKKHPDNVSKHFCGFCGMQFPLKAMREKHLDNHAGMKREGNFKCTECGIEFYTQRGLLYHDKSTHKRVSKIFQPVATPPPSKKIRINNANEAQSVYYCYLCGAEYIVKFNLQKHLEKAHTEEERTDVPSDYIRCTTCEALFYNKKAYDNHNLFHKPDDLYVTSEEQRLQTVTRVDQDFDIRRVQLPAEKFIPVHKNQRRKSTSVHVKNKWEKITQKQAKSDDELSPTTEPDSSESDEEVPTKEETRVIKTNKEIKRTDVPVIVKKRIYAIVNPDGTIQKTCMDIPKNAVLAKTDTIKIKNSDILKTLAATKKLDKSVTKVIHVTKNDTSKKVSCGDESKSQKVSKQENKKNSNSTSKSNADQKIDTASCHSREESSIGDVAKSETNIEEKDLLNSELNLKIDETELEEKIQIKPTNQQKTIEVTELKTKEADVELKQNNECKVEQTDKKTEHKTKNRKRKIETDESLNSTPNTTNLTENSDEKSCVESSNTRVLRSGRKKNTVKSSLKATKT